MLECLASKRFGRTKCFNLLLLSNIGTLDQFEQAFNYVSWSDFLAIEEEGCILLTQEFLMMLRMEHPATERNNMGNRRMEEYWKSLGPNHGRQAQQPGRPAQPWPPDPPGWPAGPLTMPNGPPFCPACMQ